MWLPKGKLTPNRRLSSQESPPLQSFIWLCSKSRNCSKLAKLAKISNSEKFEFQDKERESPLTIGGAADPELWQSDLVHSQSAVQGPAALPSGVHTLPQTCWMRICILAGSSGDSCTLYTLRNLSLTCPLTKTPCSQTRKRPTGDLMIQFSLHFGLYTKSKIHGSASSWSIMIQY